MKASKSLNVLTKIACVLLFISIFANIYFLTRPFDAVYSAVFGGMLMLTAVFAIYYILAGCKKDTGSRYLTTFLSVYAATAFLCFAGKQDYDLAVIFSLALSFGALCVLSVAKDLGRKKSLILIIITAVCALFRNILCLLGGCGALSLIQCLSDILLALTALLLIIAKYADKAARGSK